MSNHLVRIIKAYAARIFAFFFRIASLRVARFAFNDALSSDVLERHFYGLSLSLEVGRGNAQQLLWLQGRRYVKERHLLEGMVRPGDVVVDVGANTGYYALIFAYCLRGQGRILCLEPEPSNLRELRANIVGNQLENLVTIESFAAGDYNGELRFAAGLNGQADPLGSLSVRVVRIDSLPESKIDVLKIDVEGYEGAVLAGAINTLKHKKPTVFLELHPTLLTNHSHHEIVQMLTEHYPVVRAFRTRVTGPWVRMGMAYLPFVREIEPYHLEAAIERFAAKEARNPCWVLARDQRLPNTR